MPIPSDDDEGEVKAKVPNVPLTHEAANELDAFPAIEAAYDANQGFRASTSNHAFLNVFVRTSKPLFRNS